MTKYDKALVNWRFLNANLMNFNKVEAKKLLQIELEGKNRRTFIKRIRQRIIGAATEEALESLNGKENKPD